MSPPPNNQADAHPNSTLNWESMRTKFLDLHRKWKRLLRWVAYALPLMLAVLVGFVILAMLTDEPWPFLMDAQAGQVSISPSGVSTTLIPLEGAALCIPRAAAKGIQIRETSDVCLGRRVEVMLDAGAEPVVEVSERSAASTISVAHDRDGSFRLVVSAGEGSNLKLSGASSIDIGNEALVVYRPEISAAFARTVILPFQGAFDAGVEIDPQGRARDGLMRSGMISVFGHSDDNASGRRALDEFALLTGDRVTANASDGDVSSSATGYLEMHLIQPSSAQIPSGVRVVATGFVEGLSVNRHGNATINLEPSFWAKLVRHSNITTWVTAILAIFGLMAVYREASELGMPHD